MTFHSWLGLGLYVFVLLALSPPVGRYMARVLEGPSTWPSRRLALVERAFYRFAGVRPEVETGWRRYAAAMLLFNAAGWLVVYVLQRRQGFLPLNPQHRAAVSPGLAFNTSISFITNTNWQSYSGEVALGNLVQVAGLAVQNFLSAATGIAVLAALIRGLARRSTDRIGNFWVDVTRTTLYILLPLSVVLALALASQGVVQSFAPARSVPWLQPGADAGHHGVAAQIVPLGPVASQEAIKQLGTNGGGFYNVNSAHPLENPTPLSNFLEVLAILLIPAALCFAFGEMVGDRRQGWAIFAAMALLFLAFVVPAIALEQAGNPRLAALGAEQHASALQPGGNMEGKESRLGIFDSALWATATTAASNGSVNAMHESFTPLGGLVPLVLIQLGEVVFGGVGSGLYGMLVFALAAVFIAGLMVGRTPEYLGKKIEAFDMKMTSLVILIPPVTVKLGTAIAVAAAAGRAGISSPGPHGFTEVLYALSSTANNNGSAFAGIGADSPFYHVLLGIAMLLGRFGCALPVLALAGSLAAKKRIPAGPGTLPTHTPLFVFLLVSIVVVVGLLAFFPALALGPIVEHLVLWGRS